MAEVLDTNQAHVIIKNYLDRRNQIDRDRSELVKAVDSLKRKDGVFFPMVMVNIYGMGGSLPVDNIIMQDALMAHYDVLSREMKKLDSVFEKMVSIFNIEMVSITGE